MVRLAGKGGAYGPALGLANRSKLPSRIQTGPFYCLIKTRPTCTLDPNRLGGFGMKYPGRMKFGVFMAPFHRVGENPTLAMDRNLELIE